MPLQGLEAHRNPLRPQYQKLYGRGQPRRCRHLVAVTSPDPKAQAADLASAIQGPICIPGHSPDLFAGFSYPACNVNNLVQKAKNPFGSTKTP